MPLGPLTAPQRVTVAGGRLGVCVYDNPSVTNDTHDSCIVIYNDSTYSQEARVNLVNVAGGFFTGTGPGN